MLASTLLYSAEFYIGLSAHEKEAGMHLAQLNSKNQIKILKTPILKSPILSGFCLSYRDYENHDSHDFIVEMGYSKKYSEQGASFFKKSYLEKRKICFVLNNIVILSAPPGCNPNQINHFSISISDDKCRQILEYIKAEKLTLPPYFIVFESAYEYFGIIPDKKLKKKNWFERIKSQMQL